MLKIVCCVVRGIIPSLLLLASGAAWPWSNHAMGTWQALSVLPELKSAAPVKVERLESFLVAEQAGLEKLLQQEEDWARTNVPVYPARPNALVFRADGEPALLRQRFIAALRINPDMKLALFRQIRPGQGLDAKSALAWTDVTTLRGDTSAKIISFQQLAEGELVTIPDVLATASDEPDYGMDLGLWENNGTAHGHTYGFGNQPFGNPALEFSSQAPLHMGFYHENAIIYLAAGFLKRTYPEYRIHLFQTLAAYALRTGHAYWGWRFAGWALHYVQDLSQPYHARVLPGVSVPRMLWINTLDLLGSHEAKNNAISLVSNRHLALENYQFHRMRAAYKRGDADDALLLACRDMTRDSAYSPFDDSSPRQLISKQAHSAADMTDATLEKSLPSKYIADPGYDFNKAESGVDLSVVSAQSPLGAQQELAKLSADLLRNFGAHTRNQIRLLLNQSAPSGPR